jgi:hypothetical protein
VLTYHGLEESEAAPLLHSPPTPPQPQPCNPSPQDELKDFVLTYHGLEESEAFVERVIREQGPFDGLVGFSQVGARWAGWV